MGLIGINQGTVNHLSIKDANITGRDFVGGVIGQNEGQVSEIYSSGTITGQKHGVGCSEVTIRLYMKCIALRM